MTIPRKGKDRRKHEFLRVSGRAGMYRELTTVVCTRTVLRYRRAGSCCSCSTAAAVAAAAAAAAAAGNVSG